jgi:phosphate transport system protein
MIRTHYVQELESVRQQLIEMGETTLSLLAEALAAVADPKPDRAAKASELEAQTDHQHRLIHDRCLSLITLQAPVASDARLVTGVLDAIVDLELIGDYAYEIVILSAAMRNRPPSQILSQFSTVGTALQECLSAAINNWRILDRAQQIAVRPREPQIRAEGAALYQKLSKLTAAPGNTTTYVDLMLICRHLERILRHAACVADQAVEATPLELGRIGATKNSGKAMKIAQTRWRINRGSATYYGCGFAKPGSLA